MYYSMGSVSFRVPDEVKERMEAHDEVNWSAVLREHIEEELDSLESRNIAHAVATSERLSGAIDADEVAATNTAETIREFRDARYGEERT
jgi:predicted DNA-binding protein